MKDRGPGFDTAPDGDGGDADAGEIAAMLCVDPAGLGGVALRGSAGPTRDAWLRLLTGLMPHGAPLRRIPLHIADERLLGGLDLAATLATGRPVLQRGLLAESDGGIVLLCMAERVNAGTAARLATVLDRQGVSVEREGLAAFHPSRFGVVALDEGQDDDERMSPALLDRLAFHFSFDATRRPTDVLLSRWKRSDVLAAREMLPSVEVGDALREGLCAAASALGIASIRGALLALRAARAMAALHGRMQVDTADAAWAARLVLAPRATMLPVDPEDAPQTVDETQSDAENHSANERDAQQEERTDASADASADAAPEPAPEAAPDAGAEPPPDPPVRQVEAIDETVLQAAVAAIPAGLLDALKSGQSREGRRGASGRSGALRQASLRGRPRGARRGEAHGGARLSVIETLRAAAPWQPMRRAEAASKATHSGTGTGPGMAAGRIHVRRGDMHVVRFLQRSETTTVFAVDASGSAALHRLAETKGAVELLLADCYVRRDSVALISFRGRSAEVLLPPTRSLVRAKRSLAGLPGGGGTPLAAGIDAAFALACAVRRQGRTPVAVVLTDGQANIARDGSVGRVAANADAHSSARQLRVQGIAALVLDTSPQGQESARRLAVEMGATYVALPHADAARLSQAVRAASDARVQR
ncbi:magnesium chelatase subunit D [soil metagenome]